MRTARAMIGTGIAVLVRDPRNRDDGHDRRRPSIHADQYARHLADTHHHARPHVDADRHAHAYHHARPHGDAYRHAHAYQHRNDGDAYRPL